MPDGDRFARLDALFQGALEQPPAERDAWLRSRCDDPELRAEVHELLTEDASGAVGDLEQIVDAGWRRAAEEPTGEDDPTRAFATPPPTRASEEMPETVGPYRILGRLGRGGIATVYLAERGGEFSMNVALKRIRRGMDTDDIVERLRLERQILARLVHPNICRIHDGGSDEDGRPYLVMEVIEGLRIDDWCAEERLPLRRRLEVFQKVCEAVSYAHQNLVLHRDLKPSNILVTAEGEPKLLDFGIAKLLRGESGEDQDRGAPTLTRMEERLLTPQYASPEQLLGRPLNTASDVYSLGVVLYQLASGRLPHQGDGPAAQHPMSWAWARQDQDAEPVSEAARRARAQGVELTPPEDRFTVQHSAELDAILGKALEPEPERRYGSVAEMVEDLRRLLDGRPVLARHQTWAYRTLKMIRRHRTGVAVAALVAGSLLTAVVGTTWQASVAERERLRAEAEKRQAEDVGEFLAELFAVSDPYGKAALSAVDGAGGRLPGTEVTARDLLDAGARRIRTSLRKDPLARAKIQRTMARAYLNLFLFDEARALLETAVDDLEPLDSRNPEVIAARAAVLRDLGTLGARQGRFDEAEQHLRDAERRYLTLGEAGRGEVASTLERLGQLERLRGRLEEAEALLRRAIEMHREIHGEPSEETARARAGLAKVLQVERRHEEAVELFRRVLADRTSLLGDDHPLVLETTNDLAVSSSALNPTETPRIYEELLARQRRVLGPDHADLAPTLYNLADGLHDQGRIREASARLEEAWDLASRTIPSSLFASKIQMLRGLLRERDDPRGAVAIYENALDIRRRLLPEKHPETANALLRLGRLLVRLDDPRAESLLREAAGLTGQTPPDFELAVRMALADLASSQERWSDARDELRRGLDLLADQGQSEGALAGALERRLAEALWHLGLTEEARAAAERAHAILLQKLGAANPWTVEAEELLGRLGS